MPRSSRVPSPRRAHARMHKEGANLGGIRRGVQPRGITRRVVMIAAVERPPPTPAAARGKRAIRPFENGALSGFNETK